MYMCVYIYIYIYMLIYIYICIYPAVHMFAHCACVARDARSSSTGRVAVCMLLDGYR